MANKLQKLIYNLSAVAPLTFVFALVGYLQNGMSKVITISLLKGFILIILLYASFKYGEKHIASMVVRAKDVSPNDKWILAYVVTYLIPFSSIGWEHVDLKICGAISIIIICVLQYTIDAIPNPLFFIGGYHFYNLSTESGISGYILISKRKIRSIKNLKSVKRIFEFLLLDVERR